MKKYLTRAQKKGGINKKKWSCGQAAAAQMQERKEKISLKVKEQAALFAFVSRFFAELSGTGPGKNENRSVMRKFN